MGLETAMTDCANYC
uniref:Uncharacterized protein n=1 Tax=Anguilla anguilla TaxID=7936 RepID=A0A0E9UXI3_ANGAN